VLLVVAVLCAAVRVSISRAEDFASRDRFFAQLVMPMNSIVDGKSFRDALHGIAAPAQLNLWIDRRVDPTAPIEAGAVGPTVFSALEAIASKRQCAVLPVAGVLLVGRPVWVDQTAAALLSLDRASSGAAVADISWDNLTTPEEALSRSVGGSVTVAPALPHDLWPANRWTQIDRRVAITLVLAQCDLRPQSTGSLNHLQSVPASSQGQFTRRYSRGKAEEAIRQAWSRVDPSGQIRVSQSWLVASGSIAAHRAATSAMLRAWSQGSGPDPDRDTFTLKRMNTTAANALQQLADTARRSCRIDEDARQACSQVVSIEGSDVSLRTLVDRVAEQVGVVAVWDDQAITISIAK
jgi:hypothetical protein